MAADGGDGCFLDVAFFLLLRELRLKYRLFVTGNY
jgi:hypothetical protein